MSLERNKQSGFTIIEVVLVLAIAGLIFLIVFLALPQLQRSRRDTQRRNDVGRVLASMEQFAANNNGRYPSDNTELQTFFEDYFGTPVAGTWPDAEYPELSDPSTGNLNVTAHYTGAGAVTSPPATAVVGDYFYYQEAVCNGQVVADSSGNTRNIVFATILEQGGVYCGDNGGS